MNAAAIILCAGKGTRMNDDTKNKVCFDCAGIPVIKRIIENMRIGGINRFVIVIGHRAYSVMDCLDGTEGVIYAYQKEQKGTGHAAMCGFKALSSVGYDGPVIVSMGDKIISPEIISGLLSRTNGSKAVFGVQPINSNPNGGRVVVSEGKPYGIVEFADAALASLEDAKKEDYQNILNMLGLNPKKAEKVIKKANENPPKGGITLCGRNFSANEVLSTPYANAGFYCFDFKEGIKALSNLGSNNAQGEIYLTDTLEYFAEENQASLYEIASSDGMLTYSTKSELREISRHFMRKASKFISDISSGKLDELFEDYYRENSEEQKKRYISLLELFIKKYGDKKVVITRSPGRVNLLGRHIDHRGGSINVMATDRDTVFVSSPREDDIVNIANIDEAYPESSFSIGEELSISPNDSWLGYLEGENTVKALEASRGDWSNYVKSAVLRAQFKNEIKLCGMDMAACGNIPVAAGLSSSSSIVVAVMEAVVSLNCLNISDTEFINMCGEGEWFVGSRGGAGDHAAMKCGRKNRIVHLNFKPFGIGENAEFSDKYAVIVANSMIKAKKSEGSKDKFNEKVASYEFAFMILKKLYPSYDLVEFRDISKIRPYSHIYEMLKSIPETMTRGGIKALLPEYGESINRIFATHSDPKIYDLRGVAMFGVSECLRSEKCMSCLDSGDYKLLGELMKISHDGDRIKESRFSDDVLDSLASSNVDPAVIGGDYGCSTEQIDSLCDLLNKTEGVLGSEIVGAGLGGCVISLVEKEKASSVISVINEKYYDKYGYAHSAQVYTASSGSSVIY